MRTCLLAPLLVVASAALPSSALAGTASYDGATFVFEAFSGEANTVVVESTNDCEGLAAPCLKFFDSPFYPVEAPPGCVESAFLGIRCPQPASVVLDLGDQIDIVKDWDGPSTIFAGPGHDVIRGRGGDDGIAGEEGFDDLLGGPGDDELYGGPGEGTLEAYPGGFDGIAQPSDSAGADILSGGADNDTVSYEARTDPLTIVLDDQANDGAPGEGDFIASDVEIVGGGSAADTITGDANANVLIGRHGDDWLLGGAGDDELDGNAGEDALEAQDGADKLYGGGEDDALVGGPGPDYIYGEYPRGCEGLQSCVGGADMIDARDGTRDVVDCGEGTDGALLDQLDELVWAPNCETAGRPDAPAQPQGKATSACRRFKGGQKRVCTRLAKALSFCHDKRCVKKVVRRARRTCRTTYRPPFRGTCLRVVRKIVRAL